MAFVFYNPNPQNKNVGDCVIRALTKALDKTWDEVYIDLMVYGYIHSDLPSSNAVWGSYLLDNGFKEHSLMRSCKECYTLADFCKDHPTGIFVVGTDFHAVCVYMGSIWDSYDTQNMNPTYYFEKIEEEVTDDVKL